MNNKVFTDIDASIETPDNAGYTEKLSNAEKHRPKRVDINILKSKLQQTEDKEFKKNLYILSILVLGLAVLGIYLSL